MGPLTMKQDQIEIGNTKKDFNTSVCVPDPVGEREATLVSNHRFCSSLELIEDKG
jgi:hypothetical protein